MWADLFDEYATAVAATTHAQVAWAVQRGVPERLLAADPAPFAFARVCTAEDGTFQPDENGVGALIVPVAEYVHGWLPDELYDLVAWVPARGRAVWTRRREAWVLGADTVDTVARSREPLRVNATPLSWLAEDRRGVVLLDWQVPLRDRWRDLTLIDAETPAVAQDLRWNFLHRPEPPLVTVNAGPPPGDLEPVPPPDSYEEWDHAAAEDWPVAAPGPRP